MKFDDVRRLIEGVPYLSPARGKILYDFILKNAPSECLELGFAHGVSAVYVAAALDEIGAGHVTAVDLKRGMAWQQPSIEDLLERTGLRHYVTVARENLSYTWFLKKKIEERTVEYDCRPLYDFCFIDGPKNWTNDGFSFFLVDKLLNTGGHILFDDADWDYSHANAWAVEKLEEAGILVSQMDEDEKETPHIQLVFQLLVMQHPHYSDFVIEDGAWAWAKKTGEVGEKALTIKESINFTDAAKRRLRRWLQSRMH